MRPFESMVRSLGWLYFLPPNVVGQHGKLAVAVDAATQIAPPARSRRAGPGGRRAGRWCRPPCARRLQSPSVVRLVNALAAAGEHAELRMPRRPLAAAAVAREPLSFAPGLEDRLVFFVVRQS